MTAFKRPRDFNVICGEADGPRLTIASDSMRAALALNPVAGDLFATLVELEAHGLARVETIEIPAAPELKLV